MSMTYCFLLSLLLCLSLHACNARRLAAADNKKFHISDQNVEKKVGVAEKVESNKTAATKKEMIAKSNHHQLANKSQKLKNLKAKENVVEKESWRVPHNKRGEKHPGFNLDYSPPKTHPPSHN